MQEDLLFKKFQILLGQAVHFSIFWFRYDIGNCLFEATYTKVSSNDKLLENVY